MKDFPPSIFLLMRKAVYDCNFILIPPMPFNLSDNYKYGNRHHCESLPAPVLGLLKCHSLLMNLWWCFAVLAQAQLHTRQDHIDDHCKWLKIPIENSEEMTT